MRDIIWTIILIWLFWKIYDAFKNVSKMKAQTQSFKQQHNNTYKEEGEVRVDYTSSKKHSRFKPDDGEYIDYEEVK